MQTFKYATTVVATLAAIVTFLVPSAHAIPTGMAKIEGGTFTPFFDKDKDGNSLQLNMTDFYLDVAPVTNDDYLKFVIKNPKWSKKSVKGVFAEPSYLKNWDGSYSFSNEIKNKPVSYVSWFAATAFCESKNKQLPTMMQWEYVAASDDKQKVATGTQEYRKKILAWYGQPSHKGVADVMMGERNIWGVYDLHGLHWEWNLDYNTALVTGESREDSKLNKNLFCGSGSLGAKDKLDYGAFMRFGYRSSLKGNYTVGNLGFRCAKKITP